MRDDEMAEMEAEDERAESLEMDGWDGGDVEDDVLAELDEEQEEVEAVMDAGLDDDPELFDALMMQEFEDRITGGGE